MIFFVSLKLKAATFRHLNKCIFFFQLKKSAIFSHTKFPIAFFLSFFIFLCIYLYVSACLPNLQASVLLPPVGPGVWLLRKMHSSGNTAEKEGFGQVWSRSFSLHCYLLSWHLLDNLQTKNKNKKGLRFHMREARAYNYLQAKYSSLKTIFTFKTLKSIMHYWSFCFTPMWNIKKQTKWKLVEWEYYYTLKCCVFLNWCTHRNKCAFSIWSSFSRSRRLSLPYFWNETFFLLCNQSQ